MARKVVSQAAKQQAQAPKAYLFRLAYRPGRAQAPLAAFPSREAAEAAQAQDPFLTRVVVWSAP